MSAATITKGSTVNKADLLVTLNNMTTSQLSKRFAQLKSDMAANLHEMALIVKVMQGRGEGLTEVSDGFLRLLTSIADGEILATAAVAFSGRPILLRALRGVPLVDQEALVKTRKVAVVKKATRGNRTVTEDTDPLLLTHRQISQVFHEGRIVPPAEQVITMNAEAVNNPWESITVAMTSAQKEVIREAADDEGISMSDIVLKFITTKEHVTMK